MSTFSLTKIAPIAAIARMGHFASFAVAALSAIPMSVRHYRSEIARLLTDITWGRGSLIVGGGTVFVMAVLGVATGAAVGIEGFSALNLLGMAPLTGAVSSFTSTREMAPLMVAMAFASQAGCRFTAQLGSMRISEEIDALEVMAIKSLPYLVTTRVVAALMLALPLYLIGLVTNFLATSTVVVAFFGQSKGTYEHYFHAFLIPGDVPFSILKAVVFIVLMTLIHCYYGYYAQGGPQGVGQASGHAIRASMIWAIVVSTLMTQAFWGFDPGVRISG